MQDNLSFIYPADLNKAYKHRLATRIFKGSNEHLANSDRCECCHRKIGQQNSTISCCYSPVKELAFLGPGVPLLFVFVQNAIILLCLMMLFFFTYAITTNILGTNCDTDSKCISGIFNKLSISNKLNDDSSINIQTYLVALFLLLYIVFSQYLIYRIRFRNDACDQIINSPSDYSIIIKKLPENVLASDIEQLINKQRKTLDKKTSGRTNNLSVKQIILSYSLQEYMKLKHEQQQEFIRLKKQNQNLQYIRSTLPKPIKTGKFAIVVFDSQLSKEAFFESDEVKKSCQYLFVNWCSKFGISEIKNHQVAIERAPQPDDILWQNADIPKSTWVRNIILSYFFGMVILVVGGLIQYILQYFQLQITDQNISNYFSYLTSILMTVFNGIIIKFLVFVTKHEGNFTKTDYDQSLMIKICLCSFFNAGIFYSLANIIAQSVSNFNIEGTFSFEITFFMTLNALSYNISNFIQTKLQFPAFIIRFLQKQGCFKYTQKEANLSFELSQIQFPLKYSYVIRTIWLTCFYAPLAPIIIPISMVGLGIFYISESQLFRTSYKAPNMLSISITKIAIRLLDYIGIIFSGGQILIVLYIKFMSSSSFTFIQQLGIGLCLILSIILIILPSLKINQKFFYMKNDVQDPPLYDEVLQKFQVTYEGTNPLSEGDAKIRKHDIRLLRYLKVSSQQVANQSANPLINVSAFPHSVLEKGAKNNI